MSRIASVCLVVVLSADPLAWGESSSAARINPYRGMQQRQEVFEFAAKPKVIKAADGWTISFAAKAACDATVAIVGADGKLIRRLACGVLGPNAPWPFAQGMLAQSITWDGRDEGAKPAPAGWKVRVSLGLAPALDRIFALSDALQSVKGLAVDHLGGLYVLGAPNERGVLYPTVRLYDRRGRYVRTLFPPPATIPPERMTFMEWTKTSWAAPAVSRQRSGGSRAFDMSKFANIRSFIFGQSPQIIAGRFAFITDAVSSLRENAGRKLVLLDADGSIPPGSILDADIQAEPGYFKKLGVLGSGRLFMAASPDGKWLYFGGAESATRSAEGALHAVSRMSLAKDAKGRAERFVGEYEKAGQDNAHFNQPRGVACDKDGNVYVTDYGNDRIQVFKPDGSFLRTIAVRGPDQLAVHPATGQIYVLRAESAGDKIKAELVKLGDGAKPAVTAALELPPSTKRVNHLFVLDASADPPALWVAADKLWRVEDQGDKLDKVWSVQERNPAAAGWETWQCGRQGPYIAADPFREELYVREHGGITYGSPVLRVDGRTGKVIDKLNEPIENICVGPDRLVYVRLAEYPGHKWLARYDPDAHKYLPMPETKFFTTRELRRPLRELPKSLVGIPLGPYLTFGGAGRSYADQTEVAPNGDIYVLFGPSPEDLRELEKAGLPRPVEKALNTSRLLQVFSSEGERKALSALPGLWAGPCGLEVRVGPSGAVYLGALYQPAGRDLPDGIAPDGKCLKTLWGTVMKFNGAFDRFPAGRIFGPWEGGKLDGQPTHYAGAEGPGDAGVPMRVEGMLWDYPGIAPRVLSGCTCEHSSFDVDGFERVFVPAVQTCSVNVLDANGNLILRIGRYGNIDSRGPDSPVPDPRTGLLRPRRPDDPEALKSPLAEHDLAFMFPRFVAVTDEAVYVEDEENCRIVRAVLRYAAEELAAPGD